MRFLLQIAGLVLLILAAVFAFGVGTVTLETQLGLAFAGLACWCASGIPAPPASL